MKFLVDMPLSPRLVVWLQEQGHDASHAMHLSLDRATDATILEYARNEGRMVITADLDYPRLLALAHAEGPGLILFRGGNYSEREAGERRVRALEAIPTDDLPTLVVVIEKGRMRRSRLPLEPTA